MKYILLFLLFPFSVFSQDIPTKDGKAFYEFVDSSATGTQAEIFNKARLWVADAFRDSKEVIQVADKESGEISGKGILHWVQGITPYKCQFTMHISSRDNKYRAQFYDLIILGGTGQMEFAFEWYLKHPNSPPSRKIIKHVDNGVKSTFEELQNYMAKTADKF